ncbi:MAG: hypothetical protein BGP16_11170 [Sphingobium sp. 66-54]|nr:MAG: hypothetical protein BGP16_11170 [Sphingobium sp. 66-54]
MTFGAGDGSPEAGVDIMCADADPADAALEARARRLLGLARLRDEHFRRDVMGDGAMTVMLSLFLADRAAIPLTRANLALTNLLDGNEAERVVECLIHAGLVAQTGANPDRRTVGLTPLGSARMRSYISDYPDI